MSRHIRSGDVEARRPLLVTGDHLELDDPDSEEGKSSTATIPTTSTEP